MNEFINELKGMFSKCKNNILKTFLAFYSYWAILKITGINNYSIFLLFGLIGVLVLFYKVEINNTVKKPSILVAVVFSLLISVGNVVIGAMGTNNLNIFNLNVIFNIAVNALGLYFFFYYFFNLFFSKVKKINLLVKNKREHPNKIFFGSWLLIFVAWIPYFLRFFPGILTNDSRLQLQYIEEGFFDNHHPFVHTWFEGGIYNLGKILFNNTNLAMSMVTIVQMIILSAIFAYAVRFLYKHKFNSLIVIIVLLLYAFMPQFSVYSVTLWKDILFGGACLLLLISIVEMTLQDKFEKGTFIIFIIAFLMMLFFRNNGVYVLLLCTPFFLYCFRSKLKIMLITIISLFAFYFIVTGPIYKTINVRESSSVETYGMMLQHVGRVIASGDEIDYKNEKYLKTLFDFDTIKNVYKPYLIDPVKNNMNREEFDKTKGQFYLTWLSLFLKHPDTYIEATLSQTAGYWYPSVKYWTTPPISYENTYGVHSKSLVPSKVEHAIDWIRSIDLTYASLYWGIGLGFMILFISIITCSIRGINKNKYFAWFIPFVGIWATMMIASPVFAEYRYVYGLFTSMPILILIPFIIKNKS